MKRSHSLFRRCAKGAIVVASFLLLGLHVLAPLPALAQGTPEENVIFIPPIPGTPVVITGDIYSETKKQISGFFSTITVGAITALMNAAQVFTQRIAYDAAQRILTGDSGQAPLFWEQGFGDYLGAVAQDAGNQFISSINSEVFNSYGFDLCTPIDPLKLQLSLGISPIERLQATCTFARIGAAFEQTKDAFTDTKDIFDNVSPLYNPHASELSVGISLHNQYLDAQARNLKSAELDRQESQGLKTVQDLISGKIRTPSKVIEQTLGETNVVRQALESGRLNYMTLAGNAFRIGATQLGVLTASTFLNTLAVGLLQKVFDGLTGASVDVSEAELAQMDAAGNRNVARARVVFSDLLTPNLFTSEKQDFVAELASCPTPRGLWGCSMDEALAAALRTVGETGGYTVGRASHVTLNGEPPSNPAFLHKDWQLIPESDVKENADPSCYQRAYCATNLSKLRYARILPVGWEMAANSPYNKKQDGRYVTLQEVISGFNTCNADGAADAQHPWCHLIDPNWVLSAPSFQCKVKGYGETVFPGTSLRLQECADAVSCLQRDDRGNCVGGYGYCLAEKPVWRFAGDQCLERFASCRTYQGRDNKQVSFLRNTLDYGSCSADNVGCMWYATERSAGDPNGATWVGQLAATSGPRVYLDATAQPCSAANDGCTKLLQTPLNQSGLNLVRNGSFEAGVNNDETTVLGWNLTSSFQNPVVTEGTAALDGSRGLERASANGQAVSEIFAVAPVRNYTVSAYVRSKSAAAATYSLKMTLLQQNGQPVAGANFFRSAGCTISAASEVGFQGSVNGTAWQRLQCSFVANTGAARASIAISGNEVIMDAVQVEESERATTFVDGLATGLSEVHLKVPPEEFACQGTANDPAVCAKYAKVCRQTDVGCQGYRDLQNASAPEIPATLSGVDLCPIACVGYAEYRKQPSAFDLGRNVDERLNDPQDESSATFIPSTAQQCSLEDVGCEEFTNIESVPQGGEEKAYLNYVRSCEKPSQDSETYFTWEGSDTTGYQLKTWSLIHDAAQGATAAPPKILQKTGPDGLLKDPLSCNATSWQTGIDPDCRQFFNANGDAFYVYFSQTVVSSPSCATYRKNNSTPADCGKTGGEYVPATGACLYQTLLNESRSCRAQAAGCRAYIGTTGRNTAVVLEEDFRGATTTPFTTGELSNESILVGDQSLKITGAGALQASTVFSAFSNQLYSVSFWAKTTNASKPTATLSVDGQTVASFPMEVDWRRYEFGPFAVSNTQALATITWSALPNASFIDQIRIERLTDISYVVRNSWQTPAQCDQTPEGLPEPQAMLGCRAYRDRDGKTVTVRSFGHLCREEVIGCKAFINTRNSADPYAQTFAIPGSSATSKLPNTPASALEQQYLGGVTTTRSADAYVYLIDDKAFRCDASQASCRAFGKPNFRQDHLALASGSSSFETVYLLDDVTKYFTSDGEPNMLCRKSELFCDEFKSGKTVAYFRNPQNQVCEWKESIQLSADPAKGIPTSGSYSGWFRKGVEEPCYPQSLSSGNTYLLQNGGDANYAGWVGTCPAEQSECTEFRDPNDQSDPTHPSGKPYFFIKNQRMDVQSCNGKVDLLAGCVLFRDLSDSRLRWSVKATNEKAHLENDAPQTPIDCVADPSNPFCKDVGRCANLTLTGCGGQGCAAAAAGFDSGPAFIAKKLNQSCSVDTDCSHSADQGDPDGYDVVGTCQKNDANVVVKVKLDRDCAQWLGCSSSETVFDPAQQKYVDLCTDVAMCNKSRGTDAFCANYINRAEDSVLKPGAFFDRETYTKRQTGFGELDYSGYAIPDQFQIADIENRQVAKDLFAQMPESANEYAMDYRLTAMVAESSGLVEFLAAGADPLYPQLRICRHTQTGRTGYYINQQVSKRNCYFAIDALSTRSVDLTLDAAQKNVDPRNIQPLSDVFRQSKNSKTDTVLQRSFPPPECKAYPEGDAPFSNLYVTEWDFTKEPFVPKKIADGYASSHVCEYGEDCACSYRKVKYGGQQVKYYSSFGKAPTGGLCQGGSRDGQACVPGESTGKAPPGQPDFQPSVEDAGCPGGGRCLEISDVVLVRGQFGQCLQRDYSRTIANQPGQHPCLVWNPTPILSSTYDTSHYVPTAGYLPPVNAGEYYCLSYAKPPLESVWSAQSHTLWSDSRQRGTDDGGNQFFHLPGALSKFNYDRGYIAGTCPANSDTCGNGETDCNCHDGESNITAGNSDYDEYYAAAAKDQSVKDKIDAAGGFEDCKEDPIDDSCEDLWRFQNLGQGIDGTALQDSTSWQAKWCADAAGTLLPDGDEDGSDGPPGTGGEVPGIGPWEKAPDVDYNSGRWIQTGRGLGKTYMEYFVPVKPEGVAKWLFPSSNASDKDVMRDAVRERNFAQFQFSAVNDSTLAACRIPHWYVDGVSVNDYGSKTEVANASNIIYSAFTREFDGRLNRTKENILAGDDGRPLKERCSGLNGEEDADYGDESGRCYIKYWETDYRMDGVPKFDWLKAESDVSFFDRHKRTYNHERTCSKSGFAIRAVFENTEQSQNLIPESEVSVNQLTGSWRFLGFWITACTAGTNDESFLYLSLKVQHADICTELAQTVAPFSRESAAFADRVWARGNFAIPQLGYTYGSVFSPFGSAIVNGVPAADPLFQVPGPVQNYSKLKPPTFLGAGETYYENTPNSPLHKWSYLSNIFARIYRIYKFQDEGITRDDWACVDGPNKGKACPVPTNLTPEDWTKKAKEICGGEGMCNAQAVPLQVKNEVRLCNGLSGVNAGLECGTGFNLPSLDPVCHNAAMKRVNGGLEPQLTECKTRTGWTTQGCPSGLYRNTASNGNPEDDTCHTVKTAHEKFNAFGCGPSAVLEGVGCSAPAAKSKECPLEVTGIACIEDDFGPMAGHCGGGYEHARCSSDADCVFTEAQWWGAYDDGIPKPIISTDPNVPADIHYAYNQEDASGSSWKPYDHLWTRYYPADGGASSAVLLPIGLSGDVVSKDSMSNLRRTKEDAAYPVQDTLSFVGSSRWGGVTKLDHTGSLAARYPSAHPIVAPNGDTAYVRAGVCEGAVGAQFDPKGFYPFATGSFTSHRRSQFALQVGICKGGISDGQSCYSSSTASHSSWTHPNTCAPPTSIGTFDENDCQKVSKPDGSPIEECLEVGKSDNPDPDLDNNSCTHGPGYKPRTDLCLNSTDEKCLVSYVLGSPFTQSSLKQEENPTPTDVTPGFHTPIFLGLNGGDPSKYEHIAHYAPRPPMIVAPDLSRTCQTPGSCPISTVNAFSLEGQTQGAVSFAGGQGRATMQFYGWAANEQTPLKSMYVDWGDGTVVKIEGARLKNKKPFCGVTRECSLVPGLTCSSDVDCPAGGGKCVERGTCAQNPSQVCSQDSDCQVSGNKTDKCVVREFFGNSNDACEANYFEFTHAFSCDKNLLPSCDGNDADSLADKRCSRNNNIVCSSDAQCGVGDTCVAGLAPPSIDGVTGGCFDSTKNACIFTPKVLLKDSWNWCSGDCRAGQQVGNSLTDAASSPVRHIYGGCWDGTETKRNLDLKKLFEDPQNECSLDPAANPTTRPWIIYQGGVQVGVAL